MAQDTWTKEIETFLRGLIEKRFSLSQCSRAIFERFKVEVSRGSVAGKISRMGLSERKISPLTPKGKPLRPAIGLSFDRPQKAAKPVTAEPSVMPLQPIATGPICDFPASGCKWIHGDPASGSWRCCAASTKEGSPYCHHHHARAFNGLSAQQKRIIKPAFKLPNWAA
jgi:GcrA cell cycle regulator